MLGGPRWSREGCAPLAEFAVTVGQDNDVGIAHAHGYCSGLPESPRNTRYHIDHLRSIDKRRVQRVFECVEKDELAALDPGVQLFLGESEIDAGRNDGSS